jgi:two-component system alkaline phosphatase synthesis response regulator PhoP
VLVLLDSPMLVELVSLTLNHGLCTVCTAETAEQVAESLSEWQPHLLLLDMALDGLAILQQIKTKRVVDPTPLVMGLVGQVDLRSKLSAFDAGVDDILTVPFAPEELLARVIALLRRSRLSTPMTIAPVITVGALEIDIVNRTVRTGGTKLRLTPLELALLYVLAANSGRVLRRGEILDALWGNDHSAETDVADQYVRRLRARLHSGRRERPFIATVPGGGYRFQPYGRPD